MKRLIGIFILILFESAWAAPALVDILKEDEDQLRKTLPRLFSESTDLATYDQALKALMKTGHYENVFVESSDGKYRLLGKRLRVVEKIEFKGISEGDEDELRDLIQIEIGERFDRKKAVTGGEKIKEYYGERGFFNTIVEIEFPKTKDNNIIIQYTIQESKPCRIAGIAFNTPNVDLKKALDSRFRRLLGRNLTTQRMERFVNGLRGFLIDRRYLAVEVIGPEVKYNKEKTQALIEFEIKDPFRWEFYFSGYQAERLVDLYRAMDLHNRERRNIDPASEGSERLRRHYVNKGYPDVEIKTKVVNPPGSFLKRVYYSIKEGHRVKIARIEVQGRISRPARYYQDFVLHNSSELVADGYFNRADLENGFKNLVTELRNQGYLRAKVLSSRVDFSLDRKKVSVQLLIEEGPQTQIRALDFEGNKFFSSFELAQVVGLQTNSPLRLDQFEGAIEKLKRFYRSLGFLEMRLLNEGEELIQYNESGSQARINFRIYEGPRIRVNSIVVEGNTFTKTSVILREVDFKIGEILTPEKLEEATARLNKMGLFSRADIRTLEENTNVAERTLVISVAERDPGSFRFGVGVNNERNLTIRGFTGLSYNNLFGTARAISGRVEVKSNVAEINYPENEVSVGYLEPFIFNSRTRGRVTLTRSERVFDFQSSKKVTQVVVSNKVEFLAERDLTQKTKLIWKAWSLDSRREFERDRRCTPPNCSEIIDGSGKWPTATQQVALIGPTLDIDYRDNPFMPTMGSFTHLTVDYSHPEIGSSKKIEFVRTEGNFTYHKRLGSPKLVWTNSVRGGYVANLSQEPESGVPTSHAFFLGGIYTVRGFDLARDSERIPKQSEFPVDGQTQLVIRSDSHYYLFKSELRFPIFGDHGGVIFYDGGAVLVSGYRFESPYRDAVGFGYRYNTPVGPVALDFAFKLGPKPDEDDFRFHLYIGTF